jgi:hypothetical protein
MLDQRLEREHGCVGDLRDRLLDGRQFGHRPLRRGDSVEADDREISRNLQAAASRLVQRADGHHVARANDRRRRIGPIEQFAERAAAALDAEFGVGDEPIRLEPSRAHRAYASRVGKATVASDADGANLIRFGPSSDATGRMHLIVPALSATLSKADVPIPVKRSSS